MTKAVLIEGHIVEKNSNKQERIFRDNHKITVCSLKPLLCLIQAT